MRREIEYVVLARILIEQKQREKASELIGNLMIDAEKGNRFLRITELHILKTINLYYQDDIRGAVNELYAALIFGEPRGLFMTFVHEGEPVAELIDVILTEKKESNTNIYPDISVKYLENLIQVIREGICKQGKQLLEEPLSQREQEVLAYIAAGLSNKQIADSLFVSLNTIRTHTKKINSKLGVHSRTQAIAKAKDLGLIQ
jgi:LuxR family maltose regulon positive regulatory protein